jgi:hypothetical protein
LWATAYHEAGHAIAAAALGVAVEQVTIVPDLNSLGRCRHARLGDDREGRERNAIIYLAGPAVDDLRGLRRPDPRWFNPKTNNPRRCWSGDFNGAQAQAYWLTQLVCLPSGPKQVGDYLRWLYRRARNLMDYDPHWMAVGILARRLMREKTLGGREVRQALGAARGVSRQQAVRRLRRLGALEYRDEAFSLERLLTALEECESGRRKPSAVGKELGSEWWHWWWEKNRRERAAAQT